MVMPSHWLSEHFAWTRPGQPTRGRKRRARLVLAMPPYTFRAPLGRQDGPDAVRKVMR